MASSVPETEDHEALEALRDEALLYVDQALALEETSHVNEAVVMYEKALAKLDEAIQGYSTLGTNHSAAKRRSKLSRVRQQIVFRLQEHKVPQQGQRQRVEQFCPDSDLPSDAEILFSIPGEVQIFYITSAGEVSCPSYPTSLHIFRFQENSTRSIELQPAFLKVGSWVYPLVPGQSPVLRSHLGKYLFPDLDDSIEGNAVGLIFPDHLPHDEVEVFDVILQQLTAAVTSDQQQIVALRGEPENVESYEEYMEFSKKLSSGMVQGAEYVGLKLEAASIKTSEALYHGTEYLKGKMDPGNNNHRIDPKLKTGLEAAKWTASKAAQASGFIVSKAGQATLALGRFLAPHIRRHGTTALCHLTEQSEQTSQKQLDIASEVASGTVRAFSSIYMSLENSSKILARNMANNTVTLVSHKYGGEVGSLTENALSTAGNTYLTVYNAAALAPKGLAKRVAKDTGKVLVKADPNPTRMQSDRKNSEPRRLEDKSGEEREPEK